MTALLRRTVCLLLMFPSVCLGEHPIEVQRLAAAGKHYEALVLLEKLPKRSITIETLEAAGRSSWALGLTEQAARYLDQVLLDQTLNDDKRARLLLTRGIMELQELRPRVAILFAEKAYALLPEKSKLRGSVLLLWGDSLSKLDQHGAAKKRYLEAEAEVASELLSEVHYRLGKSSRALGELEQAVQYFRQVPVADERASAAIRSLSELALEREDYPQVSFWLAKGRELYPDAFLDSWVEYALARSALAQGDRETVRALRREAATKYPPSDTWVSLLDALGEKAEWDND